ncbi:MAG: branched-chain amino acid aminotransferase [Alphaproteobacteria bacterium]|nr:MAG: branched-chain amino acid aminotransferase [Alphaproteobacteria bacterium]
MASVTYIKRYDEDGFWSDSNDQYRGNPPMIRAMDNGAWVGVGVFDSARSFEGVVPDLDLHCQRSILSTQRLRLTPPVDAQYAIDICHKSIAKFPKDALLYIRLEFWAAEGIIPANQSKINFAVVTTEVPWAGDTFTACVSSYRRPDPRTAPTNAKANALYTNIHLAGVEAKEKGFDTALMLDLNDNVCEFAVANLIYVKGTTVYTPKPSACFLNGITRQRVSGLLADAGYRIEEKVTKLQDLMEADEVFSTGNLFKIRACTKLEDRLFDPAPGPVAAHAKKLYWDFAHGRIQSKAKIII